MKNDKVLIFDTTLRDGEQAPGATMSSEEKMEIAFSLERLGVDIIEAGFPVSSKGDFESVQNVAKHIKNSYVCGLARSIVKDIDAVIEAVKPAKHKRIHIFLATSKIHLQHKLKKSQDEIVLMAVEAVKYARKRMDNIEFSPEDASRTDKEFLYRILEAVIKAGATTVNIPDTVGYSTPHEYATVIAGIAQNVPNIGKAVISTHCHDDLGLAVANSLAGVQNGARQVECTINGIGERAGNASLEEVVMAMRVRPDRYAYETGVASEQIFPASQMLAEITRVPVQPNKAITGRNAFAHEAGIHQDGMLKNPLTYEIMTPQSVGVPDSRLVLGKHSGRHALALRCEQLGHQFEHRELDEVYRRFVVLADRIKKVQDNHLLELIQYAVSGIPSNQETAGSQAKKFPPAAATLSFPRAAAAGVGANSKDLHPAQASGSTAQASVSIPFNDHHSEQEDYLWGV